MGMIQEFKSFALKGNMVDMAVGIIIGAAFGGVVQSLVKDVIMPPIGLLIGGIDFSNLSIELAAKTADKEAVLLKYGTFINVLISFLIVAFAVFMLVKAMNTMKKKEEAKPAETPQQEVLLGEIRDLLKK